MFPVIITMWVIWIMLQLPDYQLKYTTEMDLLKDPYEQTEKSLVNIWLTESQMVSQYEYNLQHNFYLIDGQILEYKKFKLKYKGNYEQMSKIQRLEYIKNNTQLIVYTTDEIVVYIQDRIVDRIPVIYNNSIIYQEEKKQLIQDNKMFGCQYKVLHILRINQNVYVEVSKCQKLSKYIYVFKRNLQTENAVLLVDLKITDFIDTNMNHISSKEYNILSSAFNDTHFSVIINRQIFQFQNGHYYKKQIENVDKIAYSKQGNQIYALRQNKLYIVNGMIDYMNLTLRELEDKRNRLKNTIIIDFELDIYQNNQDMIRILQSDGYILELIVQDDVYDIGDGDILGLILLIICSLMRGFEPLTCRLTAYRSAN
ncbi:hypothetical protein pb186bvf_015509 [Paramecium bursaria]